MVKYQKLTLHQIKTALKSFSSCGFWYTLHEIFIYMGLLTRYPVCNVKYENWEKADNAKRIAENVVNSDDFLSADGKIKEISDEVTIHLRNGIQMYVRPQPFFKYDLYAIYETILRKDYGAPLPNETVIDIGAYIGDFAILAAHAGATVYAFEPLPESYQQLLRNVELAQLKSMCFQRCSCTFMFF